MPKKGQMIEDTFTGNSYKFLETSEDTNGEYVRVEVTLLSKGRSMPNHIHCFQDEKFEVVCGKLTLFSEGKTTILYAGQRKTLPKAKVHNHYNSHESRTIFIQTVTPALDYDYFLETLDGLRRDGKIRNGRVSFFQQMVFFKYLDSKRILTDVPPKLQNALVNVFGSLGHFLGYRAIYKKYSGIEK